MVEEVLRHDAERIKKAETTQVESPTTGKAYKAIFQATQRLKTREETPRFLSCSL